MLTFARNVGFLMVTGGSLAALGHLSAGLERLIVLLGLAVFLASLWPLRKGAPRPARTELILAIVLLAAGIVAARYAPLGLVYFPLFALAGAGSLVTRAPRNVRAELWGYALALCLVVVAAELDRLLPIVWHLKMAAASLLSRLAETIVREPRNLGPTAMGLPLLFALFAVAIGRATTGADRGRPRLLVNLAALAATHLAYLLLLTPLSVWIGRRAPSWEALLLNSQPVFLILAAVVFTVLNRGPAEPAPPTDEAGEPERSTRRSALLKPRLVAGFLLGALLVLVFGRTPPIAPAPVRVMIYDAGYLNWNLPTHAVYGEKAGGMFGLLPGLLQANGCVVEASRDLRRLEQQDRPDCLVLINIQDYLEPADRERILRFVREGGGLLCLGDHTGVAGIRGPFNDLLGPLGIRMKFDSATFFARSGWGEGLQRRAHPLNRDVLSDEDYQIWVGASLDLDRNATPVVVARYGFSDLGDVTELRRSYLGDRVYNPDELLGDLVLVGEARYGQGKILVFGDTSTYQNMALTRSHGFVTRSIRYLGRKGGGLPSLPLQIAALLGFSLIFGFLTRGARELEPAAALCAGLVTVSVALQLATPRSSEPIPDWSRATGVQRPMDAPYPRGLAIVDRSHGGRFDLSSWEKTSIGGLVLNFMRDGFFPVVADRFSLPLLARAKWFVMIAPQRRYSLAERRELHKFLERGGRILACVGHEELDGARDFLTAYGILVYNQPLAHFRTGESSQDDLVFLEAWPLRCPPGARTLVSQWGQPVVVSLPIRKGELIVIGDTHFLHNRNLEDRETHFPGNIRFLQNLLAGVPITPIEGKFTLPAPDDGPLVDVEAPAASDGTAPAQHAPGTPQVAPPRGRLP